VLEVEAKLRCADLAAIRERLRHLGARAQPLQIQEDTFFQHPQRDFQASDEALRLRKVAGGYELTYKGPRQPGVRAKARLEQTIRLQEDPSALLGSLGFRPSVRISKSRQLWLLDQVAVALDSVEGLGDFVEIEVQVEEAAAGQPRIDAALKQLGLSNQPLVRESYVELAVAAGVAQTRE
jgi:adenylate cyclase, class 2